MNRSLWNGCENQRREICKQGRSQQLYLLTIITKYFIEHIQIHIVLTGKPANNYLKELGGRNDKNVKLGVHLSVPLCIIAALCNLNSHSELHGR